MKAHILKWLMKDASPIAMFMIHFAITMLTVQVCLWHSNQMSLSKCSRHDQDLNTVVQ